VDVIWWKR